MALNTIVTGVGVLIFAIAWYGLQVVALRDLRERPSVRGDNKLLWAFVILCLPYAGSLGYLTFGPTSFLPRSDRRSRAGHATAPSSRPSPTAIARSTPMSRGANAVPGGSSVRADRPARPATTGRPARRLAHDPVIGTDSADLLPTRIPAARSRRPVPDAIRWPGSAIPHNHEPADAELHD